MNEEKTKKPEDLTFLDELSIQVNFNNKVNSEEMGVEENTEFIDESIDKIIYSCAQQEISIKESTVWNKRADIVKLFKDLNRLREIIIQLIALSDRKDLMKQADRFKTPIQKFLNLYILALEEVEKHKDTLDPVLEIPVAMESDIEEYQLVLEDDIMQDILSINHLILELLKKDPETHEKVKEILRDY